MLKNQVFAIDQIYVPVKRRKTLDPKTVQAIAESMLESGQTTPEIVPESTVAMTRTTRTRRRNGASA